MQRKQNRRHTTLLQQRLYIGQCWYVLWPPWRVTLLWWLHRWYRELCRYRLLPPLLSCYLSFGWWQPPFGMSWIPPLQAYPFRGCTPVWCGRNREQQGTKGKRAKGGSNTRSTGRVGLLRGSDWGEGDRFTRGTSEGKRGSNPRSMEGCGLRSARVEGVVRGTGGGDELRGAEDCKEQERRGCVVIKGYGAASFLFAPNRPNQLLLLHFPFLRRNAPWNLSRKRNKNHLEKIGLLLPENYLPDKTTKGVFFCRNLNLKNKGEFGAFFRAKMRGKRGIWGKRRDCLQVLCWNGFARGVKSRIKITALSFSKDSALPFFSTPNTLKKNTPTPQAP